MIDNDPVFHVKFTARDTRDLSTMCNIHDCFTEFIGRHSASNISTTVSLMSIKKLRVAKTYLLHSRSISPIFLSKKIILPSVSRHHT